MSRRAFALVALASLCIGAPAAALNKQGMSAPADAVAHAGPAWINLSGYLFGGAMVYNPSYAARPDNSGRALTRWGAHVDVDLLDRRLTLSYDANVFSDADADSRLRPSEHDHIVGLLARWRSLELGTHYEIDSPADRPGMSQSYVDAHARWYWDLGAAWPALREKLPRQNVYGFFTIAGFLFNETYAARPDLSGLALLRAVAHVEIDLYRPYVTLSVDLNFFTDRQVNYGLVPSELDTTVGVVVHLGDFDIAVMAENDRPIDRGGLQQSYVSTILSYRFDARAIAAGARARRARAEAERAAQAGRLAQR